MSFEAKVKQLEEIVKKLENPQITIDEGVELFDAGVKLAKDCYILLNANKGKVSIITKELNEIIEKPFKE